MSKLTMVYRAPKDLVPYQANAKKHPDDQIQALASNMLEYDFDQPIVVDESMEILKGHGRRLAALEAGIDKVPVIIRKGLTPEQKRLIRIADNKLGEAPWDMDTLMDEISFLNEETDLDLGLTGFDEDFLGSILDESVELEGIHQPVTETSSEVASPKDFTPNVSPDIESHKVTEGDIANKQEKLDDQFSKEENQTLVACPHCSEEFYIDK